MDARLSCGPFEFDARTQTVRRDGVVLPALGNRAAKLLESLLRRRGDVLTKAELMEAAWSGQAVEEGNLTVQIANLRKALGPAPDGGDWIVTVHRIGYRFLAPSSGDGTPAAPREAGSIAVLPFVNLASDPTRAHLGDGLAEDIITALSQLEGLTVIARNSSFGYRGSDVDVRRVGSELDVRCVVTGSIRIVGDRARIVAQLADAETGAQIWAETYDRTLEDVFAVLDEVTASVAGAVRTRLGIGGNIPPRDAGGTRNAQALALFHEGRAILEEPHQTAERTIAARAVLSRALEHDPTYGDAHAMAALAYITELSNNWVRAPELSLALARTSAEAAIAAAPKAALGHSVRALVAAFDHDPATQGGESALAYGLDPNDSMACLQRANFIHASGDPASAIPLCERAMRLDPVMTTGYMHHLAGAYLDAGRYETAAALLRARIALVPATDMSRGLLCVALGHLGEVEEARRVWAELMTINPTYAFEQRMARTWFDAALAERQREGLRKAGLPVA